MLSIKTGSLIKKARLTSDGKLLNQALELERARLRDHGAETGLDKYKADSIKKLKNVNDYHQYKKDCLAAFQRFNAGLECLNYLSYLNWQHHGIEPDADIMLRMNEEYDEDLATDKELAMRRKIEKFFKATEHKSSTAKSTEPVKPIKEEENVLPRLAQVQIMNDQLEWDTGIVANVIEHIPDSNILHEHRGQVQLLVQREIEGECVHRQEWFEAETVRLLPGQSTSAKAAKKVKVVLTSDSEQDEIDAFEDGYKQSFPEFVLYWKYRQLSKKATSLSDFLYHAFITRIGDENMKGIVVAKARGRGIMVLHILEEEYGNNAATQTIEKYLEHSSLIYGSAGPGDFSMRMRRAKAYSFHIA